MGDKEAVEIDAKEEIGADLQIFDEPDDELEEFDEIENVITVDDPEIADWNQDWETAGWDDEDVESDFVKKILEELGKYKQESQETS